MIIESGRIERMLKCQNPFVLTVYHQDQFPPGDGELGPSVMRQQRYGGDMDPSAPWRMYHGRRIPGFPAHPHRGFETVTVVVRGTVDHTDGLGSSGRYANGDVQWMTAGKGLQHCEMFPLLRTEADNPLELFQIWLSLAGDKRMVEPDYRMLWHEDIPRVVRQSEQGARTRITLIAGEIGGQSAPPPARDSWAADPKNHLSIQLLELDPGSDHEIPGVSDTLNRSLYFYQGDALEIEGSVFPTGSYAFVSGNGPTRLRNAGDAVAKILLLEAEPIHDPIVAHGPFVMSSMEEVRQAYADYQQTEFGGWPFESTEVVHPPDQQRFASYPGGHVEYPGTRED